MTESSSDSSPAEATPAPHWPEPLTLHAAAAAAGQAAAVREFLAAGAEVDARNWREETPSHLAAAGGHGAVVAALLTAGANLEVRDRHGRETPLLKAVVADSAEVVALLLAAGSERKRPGQCGSYPSASGVQRADGGTAAGDGGPIPMPPPTMTLHPCIGYASREGISRDPAWVSRGW